MHEVVPHFPAQQYGPGLFGNVVARAVAADGPPPPTAPVADFMVQALVDLPQKGGPTLEADIERDFDRDLKRLNARHAMFQERLAARRSSTQAAAKKFEEATKSRVARFNLAHLMYERKCRLQSAVAGRRLQELLFECLGEIEKACRRSRLLAEELCSRVVVQKTQAESSTLWREFLMRVEEDAQRRIKMTDFDRSVSRDLFDQIADECREALQASRYVPEDAAINIKRLVCVRPGTMLPQTRRRSRESRRRVSRLHSEDDEVAHMLAALNKEYAGIGQKKKKKAAAAAGEEEGAEEEGVHVQVNRVQLRHTLSEAASSSSASSAPEEIPLLPAVVHVSSAAIKWLLPPDGCAVNSVIYFCLEERAARRKAAARRGGGAAGSRLSPGMVSKSGNRSSAAYARVQNAVCDMLASAYEGKGTNGRGSGGGSSSSSSSSALVAAASGSAVDGGRVLTVTDKCDLHRQPDFVLSAGERCTDLMYEEKIMVQQFLAAFPDVLQVQVGRDGGSGDMLHFAPAAVLQVLETAAFARLHDDLPPVDQKALLDAYPRGTAVRDAKLHLYHLEKRVDEVASQAYISSFSDGGRGEARAQKAQRLPLIGARVSMLPPLAMRELCTLYGVGGSTVGYNGGKASGRGGDALLPLPDSMAIFQSERKADGIGGRGGGGAGGVTEVAVEGSNPKLAYFVLHNPTSKAVARFLAKPARSGKKRLGAKKQDKYMGLVEKDRVAAVAYGRENKDLRRSMGGRRDSKSSNKDDDDDKTSTVPFLALLVGVDLPHRASSAASTASGSTTERSNSSDEGKSEAEVAAAAKARAAQVAKRRCVPAGPISGLSVGNFCRWRGCLCEGTKIPVLASGKNSKHVLCGLHSILRSFLEGCGAKEELARHLPSAKKMKSLIANSSKRNGGDRSAAEVAIEFQRITATSALLQELLGGKLAATIRAFCRRAAADARAQPPSDKKSSRQSRAEQAKSEAAANAKAVRENDRHKADLGRDVSLSQQVYSTESEVAEELRRLCALGVFPQAELQTIRETYNELDRERVRLLSLKQQQDANPGGRHHRNGGVGAEEAELSSEERANRAGGRQQQQQQHIRTEGELELEFCKRKLAILRARRQELELSLARGASAAQATAAGVVDSSAGMSLTEKAVREAAAKEVEKAALEQHASAAGQDASTSEGDQQSLARARLQDARAFSRHHYSSSSVEDLKHQQQKALKGEPKNVNGRPSKKSSNKMKSVGAAYLGGEFA